MDSITSRITTGPDEVRQFSGTPPFEDHGKPLVRIRVASAALVSRRKSLSNFCEFRSIEDRVRPDIVADEKRYPGELKEIAIFSGSRELRERSLVLADTHVAPGPDRRINVAVGSRLSNLVKGSLRVVGLP